MCFYSRPGSGGFFDLKSIKISLTALDEIKYE